MMAGLKYLVYSMFGAYMSLFGLYFVYHYSTGLTFAAGGVLDPAKMAGHETLLYVCALLMILGFGVKGGMFPMHGWLPSAHPVAPAPASAVLSGIIAKAGVLGILRVCYYIFGASFLRGSFVQTVFMSLTLVTVFMGSMLAYLERGFKKRLAYSTVSQVSYVLFGLSVFDPTAMTGALLQMIFHAFIKVGLFLCAGAVIYRTGKTKVCESKGIGKEMPVTMWCFTILSLALVGIPPTAGFVGKWYLAQGALGAGIGVFRWLGPVVLLISALLTAGYLLPITMRGFFTGESEIQYENKEGNSNLVLPVVAAALLGLCLGMFPAGLIRFLEQIAGQLF